MKSIKTPQFQAKTLPWVLSNSMAVCYDQNTFLVEFWSNKAFRNLGRAHNAKHALYLTQGPEGCLSHDQATYQRHLDVLNQIPS